MMAINLFNYIGLYFRTEKTPAIEDTIKNRLPHEINGTDEHVSQYAQTPLLNVHVAAVSSETRDQTFGLSLHLHLYFLCASRACADSEMGQGVWTPPPHLENRKHIGFPTILIRIPWKITKLPSQIQCWVIIGPPVKRYLNGVPLVDR